MKRVEAYMLEKHERTPNIEHIQRCIEIAKENDCIVSLEWTMKWSGHYKRYIYAEDDAQDVFDNRIPHVYGL